jgi:tRNA(Met) C34 N-acetyltransferase TmcA
MPKCGFCGARLERTNEDLTGEAAAVVAAPQRRNAS